MRTLALRNLRVARQEGVGTTRNALGPLDLELRFGEIIAVTGPDRLDGGSFLQFMAGRIAPEAGGCFLDDRPMPVDLLRGMSGGMFPGGEPPSLPPARTATPRAAELLARFDLA